MTEGSRVRGVILDMDGTLIDSNDAHARAWELALAELGQPVSFSEIRPLIGMGGDNLLPELGVVHDSELGEAVSARRSAVFRERFLPHLQPFPRARELVARMAEEGLSVVVASSAKESELKAMLERVGIAELIGAATSKDDADKSKPDPDTVEAALQRLELPSDAVVMLGDSPYDIDAATRAGVGVVALRCGGFDDDALHGALAIYDDPADLLARFERSPLAPS